MSAAPKLPPKALRYRWLLVIGWLSLIFALSHMPGTRSGATSQWLVDLLYQLGIDPDKLPTKTLSFIVRKSAHFTEYFLLAIFSYPLFRHYPTTRRRAWLWCWLACVFYAASDEWHQSFIPDRTSQAFDVMVDAVGAALGGWLSHRNVSKSLDK